MDTRVQHCLWGEGRGWTCVNWKTPQKRESVPRLLSMTVGSEFKTYCGRCYKFLGRPWPAMKEYHFLKPIFRHFHAIKRLKLKKIRGKKEEEEKKISYSFTPTCLLILYCYNWADVYGFGFIEQLSTVRADKKSEKYPAESTDRS